MSKPVFKALTSQQVVLFPQNIGDRIAANHPVRIVNEVVDRLDISHILDKYKGGGTSSFHPRMMLKVLFYSYLSNIYSCRKIAQALEENIHFMWLSGNSRPDFRTINYFRGKRLKDEIQDLFAQIVHLLADLGHLSLEVQYIDGTKIASVANRYTFVWRKRVEKDKARLASKIESVLAAIEQNIDADVAQEQQEASSEDSGKSAGSELDSAKLAQKVALLNKKLQSKGAVKEQKQLAQLQKEHLPRLEKYEQQLGQLGDRNSYSKTDPEATFMRLKDDHLGNGQLKAAYNVQISTESQFISHFSVHQKAGDTTTLLPHLAGFDQMYGKQSQTIVSDAGYGSEENLSWMAQQEIDAHIKYNTFHQEGKKNYRQKYPFIPDHLYYNAQEDYFVCPMGQKMTRVGTRQRVSSNGYRSHITEYQAQNCKNCPLLGVCHKAKGNRLIQINHSLRALKKRAKQRLNSLEGIYHRKQRSIEPEAVFGQLKRNMNFTRFTMRGLDKVQLEFGLLAIGHNLRKMAKRALSPGLKPIYCISQSFLSLKAMGRAILTTIIEYTLFSKKIKFIAH